MSLQLEAALEAADGTKFRIFPAPRFLDGFSDPETIRVSVTPDRMLAGPADDRMFVVDAVNKDPYGGFNRPPYTGQKNAAVEAGADGHFDHLDVDSREFSCAVMYATVRRVLDIWQDFFGRRIEWHFSSVLSKMELIPLIEWDNAQSGFGFLEFGFGRAITGGIDRSRPYCQNFDVLAHELGHSIIFAEVGIPGSNLSATTDYGGFHESAGDLVAIVSTLHFESVVSHLLRNTKGNLFSPNELSRVGELSATRQIRVAFNDRKMSTVGTEPHDRSLPLTGALFDTLVDAFQRDLVDKGLITPTLARRSRNPAAPALEATSIQDEFDAAYAGNEAGFRQSLLVARDYLGYLLARAWSQISADFLTYDKVVTALLSADRTLTRPENQQQSQESIRSNFAWREIGPDPTNPFLFTPKRLTECHVVEQYDQAAMLAALGMRPDGQDLPPGDGLEAAMRLKGRPAKDRGAAAVAREAARLQPAKRAKTKSEVFYERPAVFIEDIEE
jgi:hypothetical protein